MVSLRLVTIDARTYGRDRHALARRIADTGADIACVQHAPSLLRWRSICAGIGRESGLVTVSGGRTGGGVLLLSTLGVTLGETRDLLFDGGRGLRPAGAAIGSLARLGRPFVFAGTRFGDERSVQQRQIAEFERAVDGVDPSRPPLIMCVDGAGAGAAVTLQQGRVAAAPGVFVDPRITVGATDRGTVELVLPD